MVPAWWERAYEAALTRSNRDDDPLAVSTSSLLTPALGVNELDVLTILLSGLQEQILNREPLTLDPWVHRKNLSSSSKARIQAFERVLQGISGLKLLRPMPQKIFEAVPVFQSERWIQHEEGRLVIELTPSELGSEVLLGFGEPYSDLVRKVQEKTDVQGLLGTKAPLALWQSTWLDLSGSEQALLLRLERAMQWEFRWLTIDGVFGMPMNQLFSGLELPKSRKTAVQVSPMIQREKLLERLGKKLVDHGMLNQDMSEDYLALSPEEVRGNWLVWQVARDRMFPEETKEYQILCQEHFWQNAYLKNFSPILKVLAGNLYDGALENQLRKGLELICSRDDHEWPIATRINETMLLPMQALFIEWNVRQLPGHPCPLPDDLLSSAPAQCAQPTKGEDFVARYDEFVALIDEGHYREDLKNMVGATFTAEKTYQEKAYRRYLASTKKCLQEAPAAVARKEAMPIKKTAEAKELTPQKEPAANKFADGNMKRVASEELVRMRKADPDRYNQLKKAYFESLNEEDRKSLKMFQEALSPDKFDDTIRQRIVKFMVENPSAWRSSSPMTLNL